MSQELPLTSAKLNSFAIWVTDPWVAIEMNFWRFLGVMNQTLTYNFFKSKNIIFDNRNVSDMDTL